MPSLRSRFIVASAIATLALAAWPAPVRAAGNARALIRHCGLPGAQEAYAELESVSNDWLLAGVDETQPVIELPRQLLAGAPVELPVSDDLRARLSRSQVNPLPGAEAIARAIRERGDAIERWGDALPGSEDVRDKAKLLARREVKRRGQPLIAQVVEGIVRGCAIAAGPGAAEISDAVAARRVDGGSPVVAPAREAMRGLAGTAAP
jgi:hypothetical protein